MEHRIVRISISKTALLVGIAAFVLGILMIGVAAISVWRIQHFVFGGRGPVVVTSMDPFRFQRLIIAPVFYGAFGYVTGAVYAALFNLIAPRIGGIPVEFNDI